MKVSRIKSSTFKNSRLYLHKKYNGINAAQNKTCTGNNKSQKIISFGSRTNLTKHIWLNFRNLSNYMKEASEMTNALIAMIGTGLIAPFAIMCSPKKKCKHAQEKDTDKDKKFFQAIRQPISAFLAFAFQVPTTIGIAMGLNHLAYKKHIKLFNDEVLGHLIPDKKYL